MAALTTPVGTATLPTPFLLAARLVALYPLHPHRLNMVRPSPDIPAIGALDGLRSVPAALWLVVPAIYLVAVLGLWLGVKAQAAALLAGGIILFDVVVNLGEYSNNRILAGLVLVLIGLHDQRLGEWPLRMQLSLMYAGATINKLFDPAWTSGKFIGNWTGEVLDLELYGRLRSSWGSADQFVSWAAIATEASLAILVMRPAHTRLAIGIALSFHVGMLVFTEGAISWLFAYLVAATLVAFTAPKRTAPYVVAATIFWGAQALLG